MTNRDLWREVRGVDVTVVPPGFIARMATSGAVPTPKFREAIERARQRRNHHDEDEPDMTDEGSGPRVGQPGGPRRWDPKGLLEHLNVQTVFAPDRQTRELIGLLSTKLLEHRPVASNGNHGELHTPTCGCNNPNAGKAT